VKKRDSTRVLPPSLKVCIVTAKTPSHFGLDETIIVVIFFPFPLFFFFFLFIFIYNRQVSKIELLRIGGRGNARL
jgi:hypothetical protein